MDQVIERVQQDKEIVSIEKQGQQEIVELAFESLHEVGGGILALTL